MSENEQNFVPKSEQLEEFKAEKPQLAVHDYAPGEVRIYAVTDRVFNDQNELDVFMKAAAKAIGSSINNWSVQQYGEKKFRSYDDGTGIRVQTGIHELTKEDKDKLEEVVRLFNEGSL